MPDDRRRRTTLAYLAAKREIERILYEVDPFGFGSTVGSPLDEYSDEAARLIPILVSMLEADPTRDLTEVLLPPVDPLLASQLLDAARPLAEQAPDST